MSAGMLNAADDDDALLRLGMTQETSSDVLRYIPLAIVKRFQEQEHVEDDEHEVANGITKKTAFARKLDKCDENYAVVVPNFVINKGPISEDDPRCSTEETFVGTSALGYLNDATLIDDFQVRFNDLPIRTKCGTDDTPGLESRYCKCV
jgi:hypothetical protein